MRINKYIALHTSLSRRKADEAISQKRVKINNQIATIGETLKTGDLVMLDEVPVRGDLTENTILLLNKPCGYVCSRAGQGNKTIYGLLPAKYKNLKTAGRLDKDSSGLLLLTNDGDLLNELTHPSYKKDKIYIVSIDKPLTAKDENHIISGVKLEDGISLMKLTKLDNSGLNWQVTLQEGKNRQIRRTFLSLSYVVTKLHRIAFGEYRINNLKIGEFIKV